MISTGSADGQRSVIDYSKSVAVVASVEVPAGIMVSQEENADGLIIWYVDSIKLDAVETNYAWYVAVEDGEGIPVELTIFDGDKIALGNGSQRIDMGVKVPAGLAVWAGGVGGNVLISALIQFL